MHTLVNMRFLIRVAVIYLLTCASAALLYYMKTSDREVIEYSYFRSSVCQCSRRVPKEPNRPPPDNLTINWCNEETTARGFNKKVLGFSLYGNASVEKESKYFLVLHKIPKKVAEYYPDWRLRFYHRFTENDTKERETMCQVYCTNDNVDLCDMNEIIDSLSHAKKHGKQSVPVLGKDLDKFNRMNWRYLPMIDPRVDVMMARDTDSQVNSREAAAVNHWLQSNFTFHIMRDHEGHFMPIMGGMFGVKMYPNRALVQSLMKAMIQPGDVEGYNKDQELLAKIFWPTAKDDAVINDSYYCQNDWNSIPITPYPTQRDPIHMLFVTERIGSPSPKPGICPKACRPSNHQDWERC